MQLVLASDAQRRERDLATWAAWGARLTPEQYQAREVRLRAHPFAREAMQTFFLVGEGAVLASCETFRMESFLAGAASCVHGVASVYTDPALRGHGHASRLLNAVLERLRAEQPTPHGSLLFSDVGPAIYERLGYVALSAVDRVLAPEEGAPDAAVDRLIHEGDLAAELRAFRRPASGLVIWPTAAQLDWHLARERCYAELLSRPRLRACGAVAGAGRACWAGDLKGNRLVVLLLDAPDAGTALALLQAARRCAAEASLREVRLWEQPLPFPWPADGSLGRAEPRDGGLPMLRPLAPGVSAELLHQVPRALWV